MSYIEPLPREELEKNETIKAALESFEESSGFLPNMLLTLAKCPHLLKPFMDLIHVIMMPGALDSELKSLVSLRSSILGESRYCQSHMAMYSQVCGADVSKIQAVWDYENSDLFTEAEKAALRFAEASSKQPSQVTQAHFDDLKQYYTEPQILEMLSASCIFAFLNRWHNTLATQLEPIPGEFAKNNLSPQNWDVGKHG